MYEVRSSILDIAEVTATMHTNRLEVGLDKETGIKNP